MSTHDEPANWETNWELVNGHQRSGGQGTVEIVRSKLNAQQGALKRLHHDHLSNRERRYRARREIDALKALDGNGTPRVLEDGSSNWESPGELMYVVTEWIDGPTLAEFSAGKPVALTVAIEVTLQLCHTLGVCHELGIFHRDIKPDNVILHEGSSDRPILLDFGLSWTEDVDAGSFKTEQGQEIGNRFLRLPEHAAGHHERFPSSDVTQVAGILFFLLSARSPRLLLDSSGRMPHERTEIEPPGNVTSDPRWSRLRRVFGIAFQNRAADRYQSVKEFADSLNRLYPEEFVETGGQALDDLLNLIESDKGQRMEELQRRMRAASTAFLKSARQNLSKAKLVAGGSGPNYINGGWGDEIKFYIHRQGNNNPQVYFGWRVQVVQGHFVSEYHIDQGSPVECYSGHIADEESLVESAERAGKTVNSELPKFFKAKLAKTFSSDED